MPNIIKIPDFDFAAFYYQDILDALIRYRRVNAPEITDENEYEPYVQLERAFALVGHLNNVLLDFAARESLLPTATLRSSVQSILKLIGYELDEATPATAGVLLELSKIFTADATLVPALAQFATQALPGNDSIIFECLAAVDIKRTDRATKVFGVENGVFSDYTALSYDSGQSFSPWATPAAGDLLLIGHSGIMWDAFNLTKVVAASGITGVWEYYDGAWSDGKPDEVTDQGATLKMDVTSLLGESNRAGAIVRVINLLNNQYEDVASAWDGSINYIETSLLGQSTPSTTVDDYSVGSVWHELPSVVDGTSNLQQSGKISFTLPQTLIEEWSKGTFNGHEAYWVRYRIISVNAPVAPTLKLVDLTTGKQYVLLSGVQGTTIVGEIMGSSTGQPNQSFKTLRNDLINASFSVFVDGEEWTEVANFLNSDNLSTHYTFNIDDDGYGVVTFGNGTTGKIPAGGSDNITIDYRIGAGQDGNVAQATIKLNKSGVAYINRVSNPRAAIGWQARRGNTPEDLELIKEIGPATVRTLERALNSSDVESLTVDFTSSLTGSKPVSRAKAIEEQYGVKTLGVILVGAGGASVPSNIRTEIENYFNGNAVAGIDGVLVTNHRVYLSNHEPHTIDVTATVYGGEKTKIENALSALLHPETRTADGLRFEWEFGEEVPKSRLISEIFAVAGVRKVSMSVPANDVALEPNELPMIGTLTITVEP